MADLIDREEAKKAMTAAVWERAARADASPLEAQLAVRAYSKVLDDLPAAPDPRDEVIRGLLEALEVVVKDVAESRAALRPHVIAKVQDILAAARKLVRQPYMGQIMAECDCPRRDECQRAGRCIAEVR